MDQRPTDSAPSPFAQATNGEWIFRVSTAPRYPLHSHLIPDPHSRAHFFIPITLSFPKRKDISTYAFIDCGATGSHISDAFVKRHSLPKKAKTASVPIYTIDDRPLSSGLLTHDVISKIRIRDHSEIASLGICSMPYPVLLGLDWLKLHNPAMDWARGQLSLSCCGESLSVPAFGKGYCLVSPTASRSFQSIASVGLGFCLNSVKPLSFLAPSNYISKATYPAGTFSNQQNLPSIIRPPVQNGCCREELKAIWAIPPIVSEKSEPSELMDIAFVDPERFYKYAKNQEIGCIWYTTNSDLDAHINSLTIGTYDPDLPPPEPPPTVTADVTDSDEEVKKLVPEKYHDYLDIFSPDKVKRLPDHRPYDINIDLEDGKTPPFGPIYSLSQDERKALFEYIEHNLEKGFIRHSTSSAASPILFIK